MKKYIVLEWIHGCGKSTVAKALVKRFAQKGLKAMYYHFPDEEDILGKAIRSVLTEKDVVHHWQVTGALYAAFANRFHYKTKDDDMIYILDRHSVTTGLIFQKDIPDDVRLALYGPWIDALKSDGIAFYVSLTKETARIRRELRDAELLKQWGVWEDKAKDLFIGEKFDYLADQYDNYLLKVVNDLWIAMHKVTNDSTIETCVDQIESMLE